MNRARKYGRFVALVVLLVAAAQLGASLVMKTQRVRAYMTSRLTKAFGRPVEAGGYSVQILPFPQMTVDSVTIGEDPAFGNEYFLRADQMNAGLRWTGLLRGRLEFGTMSFTRPSLILVRNANGRWNLEDWLPPANPVRPPRGVIFGPQQIAEPIQRLHKVEFDDGRINFKTGNEKRPFAFINVSGSVEQLDAGRWELRLEAQPWRSGAGLQSTGVLQVRGDVAGTSSRLQPAQLQVHWDRVSLADLFRLATGNDSGVRGEFALDGTASVGRTPGDEVLQQGQWKFEIHARTRQIHRWDLTERGDNPRVNVDLKGDWNLAAGEVRAETLNVELPHSRAEGEAILDTNTPATWHVRMTSAAVQAQDVLAWCRAFQPDVAEDLSAEELFTGSGELHGWPVQWDAAEIASRGGTITVPDLPQPVEIDPFQGSLRGRRFMMQPVRILLGNPAAVTVTAKSRNEKNAAKTRAGGASENTIESVLLEDFASGEGVLRLYLRMAEAERAFKVAAAFGHPLNQGWELTGGVGGRVELAWQRGMRSRHWGGAFDLSKAELQAAGLNLPMRLDDVHVEATAGRRAAVLTRVGAFGGVWSGSITENPSVRSADSSALADGSDWRFQLHTDLLDAAELDRWVGPRARPGWLQRLLPALLATNSAQAKPSELLRRVSAEGEVTADTLVVEKVKLADAGAKVSMRDLQLDVEDAQAKWAGGTVAGAMIAVFSPSPHYDVTADFTRVNLAQLPWTPRWAERWSGAASGRVHLATAGVGREELLQKLAGRGALKLDNVEFRGWDVTTSVDSGTVHTGSSHWTSGEGEFTLGGRSVTLDSVKLDTPHGKTELTGTIGFGQNGKLTFTPAPPEKRSPRTEPAQHVLQVNGPLDRPVVLLAPQVASRVTPPTE